MMWQKRKDLNWCINCWFAADIESATKLKDIGIVEIFHCMNCSEKETIFPGSAVGEGSFRFFTDEEWTRFWKENYQKD